MKQVLFFILSLSVLNFAFAQHTGHSLTNSKIAHDASHRIGRLVDTGKIDELFLKNMSSIAIKVLTEGTSTAPAYSVTVAAGTTGSQTILTFDNKGKFLANKVVKQTSAEEIPWDVNSNEILESAIHYLMETDIPNLDTKAFNMELTSALLKQQKNEDGSVDPLVILSSTSTKKSIQMKLNSKGEFISYSIIE